LISRISFIQPITIDIPVEGIKIIPRHLIQNNISLLNQFLEIVLDDWKQVSFPVQREIDEIGEKGSMFTGIEAFIKLEPHFLKCLFSYAFFFVSLEKCYKSIYSDLINICKNPKYRINHPKLPKRSSDLDKLNLVRNWSIAHIGEANSKNKEDIIGSMSWTPILLSKDNTSSFDYINIQFETLNVRIDPANGGIINTTSKLEIPDLLTLHNEVENYYSHYEDVILIIIEGIRGIISNESSDAQQVAAGDMAKA